MKTDSALSLAQIDIPQVLMNCSWGEVVVQGQCPLVSRLSLILPSQLQIRNAPTTWPWGRRHRGPHAAPSCRVAAAA